MKVVINKDLYNEYRLSLEALKELVKRKASCMPCFTPEIYYGGDIEPHKDLWEQYYNEALPEFEDIGDGMLIDSNRTILKDGMLYFYGGDCEYSERKCKDLIELVETWGEAVNEGGCELKVIEIPDGIKWEICGDGINEGIYQVDHYWN